LTREPSKAGLSTSADAAHSVAISVLAFLAGDADRLERFLSITGLGPGNLRKAAAGPGFSAFVLDYIVADEPLLLAFAAEGGVDPMDVVRAHAALGGPPPISEP
jgi:Protein of unknown function (DUF3572)